MNLDRVPAAACYDTVSTSANRNRTTEVEERNNGPVCPTVAAMTTTIYPERCDRHNGHFYVHVFWRIETPPYEELPAMIMIRRRCRSMTRGIAGGAAGRAFHPG